MEALAIIGTVAQVAGTISAANARSNAAQFNAQVAQRNAGIAQAQAAADEASFRRKFALQQGSAIAALGASGITSEGSALDVLASSASAAEYDALNIRYKGQLKSMGYGDEAALSTYKAGQEQSAGYMSAADTLFKGLGGVMTTKQAPAPVEDRVVTSGWETW